eukprot:3501714-Pyramimonas_sp.AAC.1
MGQLRICLSEVPFNVRIRNPSQAPLAPLPCSIPWEAPWTSRGQSYALHALLRIQSWASPF